MEPLVLNDHILYSESKIIGRGDEGTVFNYKDQYAIKVFTRYKASSMHSKLERKMRKLQEMLQLRDPGVAFPLGIVSSDGKELDGYYTRLVKNDGPIKDFRYLTKLRDERDALILLQAGEKVLKRLHKNGFALGDIKGNNILLEENGQPVYVDVDNYKYKQYLFDLIPDRAGIIYSMFQGPLSYQDNDKILYALMALYTLTGDKAFTHHSDAISIHEAINNLHVDRETKEVLKSIFSDSTDKPYVGEVLGKIKK